MISFVLLSMVLAIPFEDVDHRFHLDLPSGWQFAPQPGDTGGAVFRRASDGVFINAAVRVMALPAFTALPAFAARVRAASEGEPGYRSLDQHACQVAGEPGECRRFVSLVNGDPKMAKIVQQAITIGPGLDATGAAGVYGYVVHAESLAEAFPVFEADVAALIDGFGKGPRRAVRRAPHRPARWRDLVGRWRSAAGHVLVLTTAGTIVLDHNHGTYEINAGSLIGHMDDGEAIFALDVKPGRLTLTGGMFAEGEVFRHASATPAAKKNKRKVAP